MQVKSFPDCLQDFFKPHASLLVGFSGGVDSVALLHALHELREAMHFKLAACHVDHGFREESASDSTFARNFCETLEVDYYDMKMQPVPAGENLEAFARRERYKFFEKLRLEHGFDWVLTAHHKDDVLETFFIRFLANKELKNIEHKDTSRGVYRPLLGVMKHELEGM